MYTIYLWKAWRIDRVREKHIKLLPYLKYEIIKISKSVQSKTFHFNFIFEMNLIFFCIK